MMSLFFTLLFSSQISFAAGSCSFSSKTLKNGETNSLFAPGKSMEHFKTQDQDGVGSCYANTTSALLYGVLPGHPDVSYLDLALKHGVSGWDRDQFWGVKDKKFVKPGEKKGEKTSIADSGWACSTLAAAKKHGGVCPQQFFSFESNARAVGEDANWVQQSVLTNLSQHLDWYGNALKKNPKIKDEFKKLNQRIKDKQAEFSLKCQNIVSGKELAPVSFPATSQAYLASIGNYAMAVHEKYAKAADAESQDKVKCADIQLAFLNSLLNTPVTTDKDNFSIDMKKSFIASIDKAIADENIDTNLELGDYSKYQMSPFYAPENYPKAKLNAHKVDLTIHKTIKKEFDAYMAANGPDCTLKPPFEFRQEPDEDNHINMILSEVGYSRASQKSCESYFMSDVLIAGNPMMIAGICIEENEIQNYFSSFKSLLELGKDIDSVQTALLPDSAVKPDLKTLEQILAPACAQNLISLDNYSCAQFFPPLYSDENYYNWAGEVRAHALAQISSNKPVGLKICADVFENPKTESKFCREDKGAHLVTMTGYRCKNGGIEYEIQNSWGSYCPVTADKGYKDETYECELDAEGEPTGRYWMKEKALIKNCGGLEQIGPTPK